jgi:hypothetical protein
MIATYKNIWPSNPFIFRVPYQKNKSYLSDKYGESVEMVESPPEIVRTILNLVDGIDENEWIYWCIDDKYLVWIDERKANEYYNWITTQRDQDIYGLCFHRAFNLWNNNIDPDKKLKIGFNRTLLQRRRWQNFWLHQFYRAKVIQEIVGNFPGEPDYPREMDRWVNKPITGNRKLYVTKKSIALFGESSRNRRLLHNASVSLKKHNIAVPDDYKTLKSSRYFGTRKYHIMWFIQNSTRKILKKVGISRS